MVVIIYLFLPGTNPRHIAAKAPKATCDMVPTAVSVNLIVNRDKPPFDNADLRTAMALDGTV